MKSESGFGLLDAMIILVIASIAIAGLFLASIYARAQSVENYHYRAALLQAAGQLEYIKWYNIGSDGPVHTNFLGLSDSAVIDDSRNVPLRAQLSVEVRRSISDRLISLSTVYDRVEITASWYEKTGIDGVIHSNQTKKVKVVLVEDYYYQYGGN